MRRAWRRRAVPVGDVLRSMAPAMGLEAYFTELEILKAWPRCVGRSLAEHSCPVRLEGGRLVIHATDSAWLYRLSMMRRDLVRAVNDHLKHPAVREVRLRIGPVGEARAADGKVHRPEPDRASTVPVGPAPSPGAEVEDAIMGRVLAPVKGMPFADVVQRILRRQAALGHRR
jgi:hypothetical protein